MIVCEAVDVMVKGKDARRGADTGLTHRTAEALLPTPNLVDEIARAGDDAADRRAQAF